MTWTSALLLALLQGFTEFLPVSSSGHLDLFQSLLRRLAGRPLQAAIGFDLILHLGTLVAVFIYFRGDLANIGRDVLAFPSLTSARQAPDNGSLILGRIALALLPTGLIGLPLRDTVESLSYHPSMVAALVGVTGLVLLTTRWAADRSSHQEEGGALQVSWIQALGVGAAQGLAVLPGLSRSGLTIAAGLALGMRPLAAFRWSFLLSIPAISGASLWEISTLSSSFREMGIMALAAALLAALTALLTLHLLARTVGSARFHYFAWYCLAVAATGMIFFWRTA